MERTHRWLPWLFATLALLLTGVLQRSFHVDTRARTAPPQTHGCQPGGERHRGPPTPSATRSPPDKADPSGAPPVPAPRPAPSTAPRPDTRAAGVVPVLRPIADLPSIHHSMPAPATLLLGVTEAGTHHVLAWQAGRSPRRVITSPEPVTDLVFLNKTLLISGGGDTPVVRTWTGGPFWTQGPSLDGLMTLHRDAGAVIAAGRSGASVYTGSGWTRLPIQGPVSAAGRAVAFGGPTGSPLLIGVDTPEGATLRGCDTATQHCREAWTLGPGLGCGLPGPLHAAALRMHLGHLIAHPLRAGIPQGPERSGRITVCPTWLDHPMLGMLSLGVDGPLGRATSPQVATLYDINGGENPDLFAAHEHGLWRVDPRADTPAVLIVQFSPAVTITTSDPVRKNPEPLDWACLTGSC